MAAFTARFMIEMKIITCCMLLCIATWPILYSYFTKTALKVGQVGLGISMAMAINGSLTLAILLFSDLEMVMVSMSRYKNYFLQDRFSLNEKFESMGETILSGHGGLDACENAVKKRVSELVKRRKAEFRDFMFRRYRSVFSTLFYKPRIDVLDVTSYLPAEHSTVTLDQVCVPQPAQSIVDTNRYILSDVSATIRAGDVVGIVGRTGAGKSTLLNVLQNIVRKREGSVLLDGRELNSIPRSVLRHVIGVLPQLPFVFKGWTLRRFLDPRMMYSDDEIFNALECCGLLDLVNSVPGGKGLDVVLLPEEVAVSRGLYLLTPLIKLKSGPAVGDVLPNESSERGAQSSAPKMCFSTSQLRMLSFARLVLYRSPYRILLVDEPPSDSSTSDANSTDESSATSHGAGEESLSIYKLVRVYFKHCTTFIVAHDRNVLNYCNSVWEVDNGRLIRKVSGAENVTKFLVSYMSSLPQSPKDP